jgi:hypothetical protein
MSRVANGQGWQLVRSPAVQENMDQDRIPAFPGGNRNTYGPVVTGNFKFGQCNYSPIRKSIGWQWDNYGGDGPVVLHPSEVTNEMISVMPSNGKHVRHDASRLSHRRPAHRASSLFTGVTAQ